MSNLRILTAVIVLALTPAAAVAQSPITLPRLTVWDAEWRNPEGHFYTAVLRLEIQKGRWVEGALTWTLHASPRAEEQAKLGMSGVEYVRGEYHERTGLLEFEGIRLEDPHTILGSDKYQLTVDSTAMGMAGKTSHGGTWAGVFTARRR
jgi:hypothetical protein